MVIFVRFVAALLCGILVPQRVSAHGSMDQQIAYASSEIADHPGSARRYLARAELHRIHKDWYAALADLKQAESLDADLQFVQLSRGKLYAEQGLLVAAHRALSAFVEKQPESTDGLITLARVLVQQGENEQSVAIFDRAIRSTPQPAPDYYLEVARACAACGPDHLPQAIERLNEGVARLGPLLVLEAMAVDFEMEAQDFDAALARADRVLKTSGKHIHWLLRRASILEAAGQLKPAQAAYGEALAVITQFPSRKRQAKMMADLESETHMGLERVTKRISDENDDI